MHNLHLFITSAESHKEAWDYTETYIQDFGNENNWRTICGSIDNKNDILDSGEGRFQPSNLVKNINDVNNLVKDWFNDSNESKCTQLDKLISGELNKNDLTSSDLYYLNQHFKFLYELKHVNDPENFNIFNEEFYSHQYDQCGVTNTLYQNSVSEDTKLYVVFIDMHS